jgi:hypothetical protein
MFIMADKLYGKDIATINVMVFDEVFKQEEQSRLFNNKLIRLY